MPAYQHRPPPGFSSSLSGALRRRRRSIVIFWRGRGFKPSITQEVVEVDFFRAQPERRVSQEAIEVDFFRAQPERQITQVVIEIDFAVAPEAPVFGPTGRIVQFRLAGRRPKRGSTIILGGRPGAEALPNTIRITQELVEIAQVRVAGLQRQVTQEFIEVAIAIRPAGWGIIFRS